MRTDATLYLSLRDEFGTNVATSRTLAGPFVECFDPVDVCSDAGTAMLMRLGGKNAHTEDTVRIVRKRREHYAKLLADSIAKELVEFMERNDTRNGYRRDDIRKPEAP